MYYFIVNPNSRSGAGRDIWNQLRKELTRRRVFYHFYFTEYVGHAKKLSERVCSMGTPEEPVYLIAVGGDGTIYETLTGLTNLEHVIFGFIPTGSGNDFCRSMKLPLEPFSALDAILKKERIQAMDVPYIRTANRRLRFGISTGIGFDAAVCQGVQASRLKPLLNRLGLGKLSYACIALAQILFMNPTPMVLYLDGNRKYSFRKVYFTAVMNQKYEGGGFMFCPSARSDDGVLDILVVEGLSKLKLLCCLPTAFFGKHARFKGVHLLRCREARIDSAVLLPVHIDGEHGGLQSSMSVGLEKQTLKIIMPGIAAHQ